MNFDRTGIILYVLKYPECVEFYQNTLGLKIMFQNDFLTCFEFGNAYLMVEPDEDAIAQNYVEKGRDRICLRMNVPNVRQLADRLTEKNIKVDYQEHDWGTIAKFHDPDGNLCAFKDSEKFEKQILEFTDEN